MNSVELNNAISAYKALTARLAEVTLQHEDETDTNRQRLDQLAIANVGGLVAALQNLTDALAANTQADAARETTLNTLDTFARTSNTILRAVELSNALNLNDTRAVASSKAVFDLNALLTTVTNRVSAIESSLLVDTTALDTLQEVVDFIELNASTLASLTIASIAGLQAALDNKSDITHRHNNATTGADGFLSAVDKTKLDTMQQGAQVNRSKETYENILLAIGDSVARTAMETANLVIGPEVMLDHMENPGHDDFYMPLTNGMLIRDNAISGVVTVRNPNVSFTQSSGSALGNVKFTLGTGFYPGKIILLAKACMRYNTTNILVDMQISATMSSGGWVGAKAIVSGETSLGKNLAIGLGTSGGFPAIWLGTIDEVATGSADLNWGAGFINIDEMQMQLNTGSPDHDIEIGMAADTTIVVENAIPTLTSGLGNIACGGITDIPLATSTKAGLLSSAQFSKLAGLIVPTSVDSVTTGEVIRRGDTAMGVYGTSFGMNKITKSYLSTSSVTPVLLLAKKAVASAAKTGFSGIIRYSRGNASSNPFYEGMIAVDVASANSVGANKISAVEMVTETGGTLPFAICEVTYSSEVYFALIPYNSGYTAVATPLVINFVVDGYTHQTTIGLGSSVLPIMKAAGDVTGISIVSKVGRVVSTQALSTTVSSTSTDTEVPSAKAVYEMVTSAVPPDNSSISYTLGTGGDFVTLLSAIYALKKVHIATGKSIYLKPQAGAILSASFTSPIDLSWLVIGDGTSTYTFTAPGSTIISNVRNLTFKKVNLTFANVAGFYDCDNITIADSTLYCPEGLYFTDCLGMKISSSTVGTSALSDMLQFVRCNGVIKGSTLDSGGLSNEPFLSSEFTFAGGASTFRFFNGGTIERLFSSSSRFLIDSALTIRGILNTPVIWFLDTDIVLGSTLNIRALDASANMITCPVRYNYCNVIGSGTVSASSSSTVGTDKV